MAWTVAPVRPDAVLHASEDPTIEAFVPHVPATNPGQPAMVWTIERRYSPLYLFPRDCPRVAVWANDRTQRRTLSERFGATTDRVQFAAASDQGWVSRTTIHEYVFDATPFEPWPEAEGQWVTTSTVRPLAVLTIDDLVREQARRGAALRFVGDLGGWRDRVLDSGLPFSIVRWRDR